MPGKGRAQQRSRGSPGGTGKRAKSSSGEAGSGGEAGKRAKSSAGEAGRRAKSCEQSRERVRALARETMLHADVLAVVLRVRPASESVIEGLLLLQAVCKTWKVAIELATADRLWLAPFVASGRHFMNGLPAFLRDLKSVWCTCFVPEALAKRLDFENSITAHFSQKRVLCRAFRVFEAVLCCRFASKIHPGKAAVLALRAMQAHPHSKTVLSSASDLLIVIAGLPQGPHALVDAGVAPALTAALARFGPSSAVLNAACALMNAATPGYARAQTAMVEAGFVHLLLGTMQRNHTALNFQLCSMRCVRALCRCKPHALVLREAGVGEVLFGVMRAHPFVRQVQVDAVHTLLHVEVAQPPGEGVDYFAASRGMQLVIDCSIKFNTHALSLQSIRLLEHLRDKTHATTARLLELGAVHFVLFVAGANPTEKVLETAARVLNRLSAHAHFPADPNAAEVEGQVACMAENFAGNDKIRKFAQQIHERFARRAKLASP